MSPNEVMVIVRAGLLLLLYGFLTVMVGLLWRDLQQASPRRTRQVTARLHPLAGGAAVELRPVTSIGRAASNSVVIRDDDTCSLEHALISWRAGRWWLEDLNSRNGTLLNGNPVTASTALMNGDVVQIGQQQFRFEQDRPVMDTAEWRRPDDAADKADE